MLGGCVQILETIAFWNYKNMLKGCSYLWLVMFSHYNNE